jgi:maltose-binding protein MalE
VRRGFDFNWAIPGAFWYVPNTMMHQLGANLIDEDAYKANLDRPVARQVFQYFQDWTGKLRLGGPQYTDSRTEFLAGKLGAECSFGIWGVPQMDNAKISWTVLPVPKFAAGVSDNGMDEYAFYMMVNARSAAPVQKAAWKLARFYTDHAGALFAGAGLFVPRAEVMDSASYKNNPAAPFFVAELKKARFSPRVVGYAQVLDAILRGRDKVVQGEKVEAVMPVMNEEVNTIMNRERARAASLVK